MATIDEIKAANPIAEVIGETFRLEQKGTELQAVQHDSLKVNPNTGLYFWFKHQGQTGWSGSVIDWVMYHAPGTQDVGAAIRWLCDRAGLPYETSAASSEATRARREREEVLDLAARVLSGRLALSDSAKAYVSARGWSMDTARAARLGYTGDKPEAARKEMVAALKGAGVDLECPAAVAVIGYAGDVAGWAKAHELQPSDAWLRDNRIPGLPVGHLVYTHVLANRVVYLSLRLASTERKGHYNLPQELAGPKQMYANWLYRQTAEQVAVVEGQADAVTLGQWEIPAIALAGNTPGQPLVNMLDQVGKRYAGLDADDSGASHNRTLAKAMGPRCTYVVWPAKDVNAWALEDLQRTPAEVQVWLNQQPTYVQWLADRVSASVNGTKEQAIMDLAEQAAKLGRQWWAIAREDLASRASMKVSALEKIVKAREAEDADAAADADVEELPDDLPELTTSGREMIGDHFVDLIWDTTHRRFRLAVRGPEPDYELSVRNDVEIKGVKWIPPEPSELMGLGDTIIFPDGLNEKRQALSVVELHKRIVAFANKYFDADAEFQSVAAYYIILTWLYDCFQTIGYLRMVGPYGVGKSRFTDTYGYISYRAIRAAGSSSVSPIFRTLHLIRGTLVMDEINAPDKSTDPELEMIFKLGSSRRSPAILRTGGDKNSLFPEGFQVYGPKIFGAIKRFNDPATDSRCITYRASLATTRTDIPKALQSVFDREAAELRRELMTFRMAFWETEKQLDYTDVDPTLEPRSQQIGAALFTLVKDPDARAAITAMLRDQEGENRAEREMSIAAKLLQAVIQIAAKPQVQKKGEAYAAYWDMRLTVLVQAIRDAVFDEEDAAPARNEDGTVNQSSPRNDKSHWVNRLSPKRVSQTAKTELGLRVEKCSWHPSKPFGVTLMADAIQRLPALCRKYGVEFVEPGSQAPGPRQQLELQEPEQPPDWPAEIPPDPPADEAFSLIPSED
ncbi:MAG TPA: hypothetical protein PLC98_03630 [Anaerolineales bacterium]|nr:hypothetical protein [Anaerolineales bacterium]